jgi:hypothetical protein
MMGVYIKPMKYAEDNGNDNDRHGNQVEPKCLVILE